MTKPVILTGLRANNDLHIGNYFGAMLPIVDMAISRSSDYQINMFIPDLHSFTTPIDHEQLYDQILHNARLFAAAGLPLDNPDIHLYRQSYVSAHSELTWILDCFTGMGEMSRMTQYKDKSGMLEIDSETQASIESILSSYERTNSLDNTDVQKLVAYIRLREQYRDENFSHKQSVSVGLYNYPVLMAADILLYNATYVPVGDDQSQHIEFARDIAERINNRFGDVFTVPEAVAKQHEFFGKDQGLRIKDLQDPTKKMSKSDDSGKGVIFLGDDPDEALRKVQSATTDSLGKIAYDPSNQPGISNLLQISSLLSGRTIDDIVADFADNPRYGDFKAVVGSQVREFLVTFQDKLRSVDDQKILAKLEDSEKVANETANATLLRAQQAVGLRPKGI